jgi:hypothetical protein
LDSPLHSLSRQAAPSDARPRRREQRRHDCTRLRSGLLPDALHRKYPNAARQWAWQFVFAAEEDVVLRDGGRSVRWHLHERSVQRAMAGAVRRRGIAIWAQREPLARWMRRSSCRAAAPPRLTTTDVIRRLPTLRDCAAGRCRCPSGRPRGTRAIATAPYR